jgi:asparagine synthase (glutamine-hydrolysing)
MFFSAFVGNDRGMLFLREALGQHAHWLGLAPWVESLRLVNSKNISFGWLDARLAKRNPRLEQTKDHIVGMSFGQAPLESPPTPQAVCNEVVGFGVSNAIKVEVDKRSGEVSFFIPPATPEQFYFSRTSDGYYFSDDLRLFRHLVATQLDERSVFALFQYGAIPPPLTVYQNVHRIPGGHVFRVHSNPLEHLCTPFFHLQSPEPESAESNPESKIERALDDILTRVPESASLFFSGGVDSALLAAQLAQLGRTDVELINYSFGKNDEESRRALHMASHFGMKWHQVNHDPGKVGDVLGRIAKDYSFPFGDCSTVPTNILVHESLRWATRSGVVIEGTGADGAFGVGEKHTDWSRVYAIPTFLRQQANPVYRWLRLWKGDSALEHLGRVARKSVDMPLGPALVAENALAGIAYNIPDRIRWSLHESIRKSFGVMSAAADPKEQLSFLDLAWVGAGRLAPKSFEPLRKQGIQAIYPFLELPMLLASSSIRWADKCPSGETKGLLKSLLARSLDRKWIYRPKCGFAPPHRELLGSAGLQEFLHGRVLSPQNPLMDLCERSKVTEMIERARKCQKLSPGVGDFLWTLTFASGWLAQLPERTRRSSQSSLHDSVETGAEENHDEVKVMIAN